ncbi:MAG: hypothetical protein B7Y39_00310 [Bdellovibrio sp. 28-41-41]|nr:MAG: hypothetical protein B7Y39_00310 [Bdellovibrio sp. 28-41-41]
MAKDSINSLSEAIAKLESISQSKTELIREHIEKDYEEIKSALEDMRPYFDEIKNKVEQEAKNTKTQVETKVKENPWIVIGVVGLIAFFLGIFLGRKDK